MLRMFKIKSGGRMFGEGEELEPQSTGRRAESAEILFGVAWWWAV